MRISFYCRPELSKYNLFITAARQI